MNPVPNFEQYVAQLKAIYEEDPLLMITPRGLIPCDNESIALSAPPKDIEKMLNEMGFVQNPSDLSGVITGEFSNCRTNEPLILFRKFYGLKGGLTRTHLLTFNEDHNPPLKINICDDKNGDPSFCGNGRILGEMNIYAELRFNPYNRGSKKQISPEEYEAMKQFYTDNAQKKIGNHTVAELLRDAYFTQSFRIFADEFITVLEYLSKQDCQMVFQHCKGTQIVAIHNLSLK